MNSTNLEPLEIPVKSIEGHVTSVNKMTQKNRPVYLKFWATWCQPCREQMPHLQHTYEKFGKNIDVIAINLGINDSVDAVNKVKKEYGLTLPIVIDDSASLAQAYDLIATPYHILLDNSGNVLHKGHEANEELDKKIKILSEYSNQQLPIISIDKAATQSSQIDTDSKEPTILFFASAWCDWYLEKSRPQMSENCQNAQNTINTLYKKFPNLNWSAVVTRLWTGTKELDEYKKKYQIKHPIKVDTSNKMFLQYKVKNFPTLIAIRDGKELFRVQNFSDPTVVSTKIAQFAAK